MRRPAAGRDARHQPTVRWRGGDRHEAIWSNPGARCASGHVQRSLPGRTVSGRLTRSWRTSRSPSEKRLGTSREVNESRRPFWGNPWMVAIIGGTIAAILAAAAIGVWKGIVSSSSTPSSSSIPLLNNSYVGPYADTTQGTHGQLAITNTRENTATGTFTSSGTIETPGGTCSIQNTNGQITADGKMTWTTNYEQSSACNAGKAYATGQLHDGVITGSWTNADPSTHDTGTFTLS